MLFGSPFLLAKVPIRSPSDSKLGPHWVPILDKIGSPWQVGAVHMNAALRKFPLSEGGGSGPSVGFAKVKVNGYHYLNI